MENKTTPILLYHPDPAERSRIVRLTLLACLAPVIMETRESLVQAIITRKYNCAQVYLDPTDAALLQALKVFREKADYRHIQFLIVLSTVNRDHVNELIKAGFYSILTLNQSDTSYVEKMTAFLNASTAGSERRQHIRLNLMDYENAKLILNLPNGRKIATQVKNISVGGLGISFRERLFVRFSAGDVLTDSVLVIKDLDMSVDVKIIAPTDKGLALQFIELPQPKLDTIAQFIQERIQFEFR